jgi:arabinofuranosyltransferase
VTQEDRSDLVTFTIVIASFLGYAALFVYRTSFVVNGERYFSLFDDAMISMRYASHLANGQGLVWNSSMPPVEGYTNPLWVLYMACIHLLPIAPSKISLVVQITAVVCLAINLYFVRRISLSLSDGSPLIALGAVVLTALYLPINNWSLQGMEVSVLVMTVTICVWLILRYLDTGAALARPSAVRGPGLFAAICLSLLMVRLRARPAREWCGVLARTSRKAPHDTIVTIGARR